MPSAAPIAASGFPRAAGIERCCAGPGGHICVSGQSAAPHRKTPLDSGCTARQEPPCSALLQRQRGHGKHHRATLQIPQDQFHKCGWACHRGGTLSNLALPTSAHAHTLRCAVLNPAATTMRMWHAPTARHSRCCASRPRECIYIR